MSDLMRIALSGLVANQAAMNTTGHNIAGAGVEGFSRQRVELGAQAPQYFPGGYVGRGVDIVDIQRTVDDFITRQLRTDTWVYNSAQSFRFYSEQIDSVLSDPAVGLSGRLDTFFPRSRPHPEIRPGFPAGRSSSARQSHSARASTIFTTALASSTLPSTHNSTALPMRWIRWRKTSPDSTSRYRRR